MGKKFMFFCSCLALLWFSSGSVLGQTGSNEPIWWDSGCLCDGTINYVDQTVHGGLSIDGWRYTYWYSVTISTTPASSTCTLDNTTNGSEPGYTPSNTVSGVYLDGGTYYTYWYEGTGWSRTSTPCTLISTGPNVYSCEYCYGWELHRSVLNYPEQNEYYESSTGFYQWCESPGQPLPVGYRSSNPTHSHSPLTVDISDGAICSPNHFNHFWWRSPRWSHREFIYTPSTTGYGSWARSGSNVYSNNVAVGHFIVEPNANIRLTDATDPINSNYTTLTTYDLSLPTSSYSMRFDGEYNGQIGGWTYAAGSAYLHEVTSGQRVGYWGGVSVNTTFYNGSRLYIGPTTTGQTSSITLNNNTPGGLIEIENYLCLNDPVTGAGEPHIPYQNHGMWYNIPSSSVTNIGTINLYNNWTAGGGCVPTTSHLADGSYENTGPGRTDRSYIQITNGGDSDFDDIMAGIWNVWTEGGNVYIHPSVGSATTTAATGQQHTFVAKNGMFDMNQDFNYSNSNSNAFLQFNGKRLDCCGFAATMALDLEFTGLVGTAEVVSDKSYVYVDGNMLYDASATTNGGHLLLQGDNYVEITGIADFQTNNNNYVEISAPSGAVKLDRTLEYVQTGTSTTGLFIEADGKCDTARCEIKEVGGVNAISPQPIRGGYVWLVGDVTITNVSEGVTVIKSGQHYVRMDNGIFYKGIDSTLLISGYSGVDIYGKHPVGTVGVRIERTGKGSDSIYSEAGHIFVRDTFAYIQSTTVATTNGLSVIAEGDCEQEDCLGNLVEGYVWLQGNVTTRNVNEGFSLIRSTNHFVRMSNGYAHTGINGNMTVKGYSYVDILGQYINVAGPGFITIPQQSGTQEGVYIARNGIGQDSIWSNQGHVKVEHPFTYIQHSNTAGHDNTNGLAILADGPCTITDCNSGGYVWLQKEVWTFNDDIGPTVIESGNHYIRIGTDSRSQIVDGARFTHSGISGDLTILAQGDCQTTCTSPSLLGTPDDYLWTNYNNAHNYRGYVWIGDDVKIRMNGTLGDGIDGNAVIRSTDDVVHLDDSVTFIDHNGSNLWIDGNWGVRTLGPTILSGLSYNRLGRGTAYGVDNAYDTNGQGFITYHSARGYVDFGMAPGISDDINWNNPFLFKTDTAETALLIEGFSRVFFGDSVTIQMGNTPYIATSTVAPGNAKIYSPGGWIAHTDTTEFSGYDGDYITYANGNEGSISTSAGTSNRSCWWFDLTCAADRGGFVLYDSIFKITYEGQGVTWIRSSHDDVIFGDSVLYENTIADPGEVNGEIIIQAGQDILGRNHHQDFIDAIRINQFGEKSILFEAKKSIHIEQNLFINRDVAYKGDITLKAGYNSFSSKSVDPTDGNEVISQPASGHDATPSADLDELEWGIGSPSAKGDCIEYDYEKRFGCWDLRNVANPGSTSGGDIWFEGHVLFDLTRSAASGNEIKTTLRAFNSIYIDSTFIYDQAVEEGGDVLLFAEIGNVEAAVTRQNDATSSTSPNTLDLLNYDYVADDVVHFNIDNPLFNKEIRIQAGNQVWGEATGAFVDENAQPTYFSTCWITNCNPGAEFNGNILFNKPFVMDNNGSGYTILSSARDIESQIMAPFTFNYADNQAVAGDLKLTAGRHLETHAKMTFDYQVLQVDTADITMEAGRLNPLTYIANSAQCKATEEGTTLTGDALGLYAFDPDVETGGVNGSKNNEFSFGGQGNGSILLFDSVEFNYNGIGKIFMVAENGNIESDPYLHRWTDHPTNPGNQGQGYVPGSQHDAQITFNHGGAGVTELKAIDIKLHDKLLYDAFQTAPGNSVTENGQFRMTAYDSILTRNIQYLNRYDTGSVFITTAKFKATATSCNGDYCTTQPCGLSGIPIQQGHIVLGYGADVANQNINDSIIFDFTGNPATQGANVYIRAGYEGFERNTRKGKGTNLLTSVADKGKGYGGNITFDFMQITMATGNHTGGGFLEISTPNGNIWGKDSIVYRGFNGDILVDAGLGSKDDNDAIRWEGFGCANAKGAGGAEKTLNTNVPLTCDDTTEWRTGNIMMKGASLDFAGGTGNATFRTREGFIDTYDAFTVEGMRGHLLKYAGTNDAKQTNNQWGDVSERDFKYTQIPNSGSIFFGADDNIMLNYGYSNDNNDGNLFKGRGQYDVLNAGPLMTPLVEQYNPFYSTTYKDNIDAFRAIFNVNEDGYLWYHSAEWPRKYHRLYRGCSDTQGSNDCSGFTGDDCQTTNNFARPLMFDFNTDGTNPIVSGGLAVVATNYIDMFTKFTYLGGGGSGLASVPGMGSLHGQSVAGYGLYIKSLFTGQQVESRRAVCENCGERSQFPIGRETDLDLRTYEWTYVGFHDDARIHTHKQKTLIEAPVVEFFGHAELDAFRERGSNTSITIKADSLVFHDSAIFMGKDLKLTPFTTGIPRDNDMRYGVINDRGYSTRFYREYGPAITMDDRNTPIMEFGYQRCNEPMNSPHEAPNLRSLSGKEVTPRVGGDIIVKFMHDFALPIQNTVVANHARISFMTEKYGIDTGDGTIDACVRTDLLRIRNKVEFYTDPALSNFRVGTFAMTTTEQMPTANAPGIYPRHLHLEPGSELSIPGESLLVISTTAVGGYGEIHENVFLQSDAIIAPGFASMMEGDCTSPYNQGKMSVHNLLLEKDAVMRISISSRNCQWDPTTNALSLNCTQTDTLVVQDTIFTWGKIQLHVLPETEYIERGCYLFLIYNDLSISKEHVMNLELATRRIGDHVLRLDLSEPGRVYLCVTDEDTPIIQRYINIHEIEGVTTNPVAGIYHFVQGHQDFVFTATYSDTSNPPPYDAIAYGYYSKTSVVLPATYLSSGVYEYIIRQVVQPWDVYFSDELRTVGNNNMLNQKIWAFRNTLFVNVDDDDIVSVYNLTGMLFRRVEIPAGLNKMTLDNGVYMVTLKDGSVYRIIIN